MVFEVLSGGACLKSLSLRLIGQRKFGTVQGEARLLVNDGTLKLTPIRDASVVVRFIWDIEALDRRSRVVLLQYRVLGKGG